MSVYRFGDVGMVVVVVVVLVVVVLVVGSSRSSWSVVVVVVVVVPPESNGLATLDTVRAPASSVSVEPAALSGTLNCFATRRLALDADRNARSLAAK